MSITELLLSEGSIQHRGILNMIGNIMLDSNAIRSL